MSLQDSEKHAAQQHADRIADIRPTPEAIRGPRVLTSDVTPGRFYQAVFNSGNVYYVQALPDGGGFKVISQEVVKTSTSLAPVGGMMKTFDSDERLSGKLYKFTQRQPKKPVEQVHPDMVTYPDGTTAKDIGAKVGDQFIVVASSMRDRVGDIVTLYEDDDTTCPFFKSENGRIVCIGWGRLAPLVPAAPAPEPEPVKPIPEALQIGDRVRYTEKSGLGIKRLVGELGTVTDRYSAGAVDVAWDCGCVAKGHGHNVEYLEKVAEPASAVDAQDLMAWDETYALPAQPIDPVTACKQRIDAARAEIERLASEQRVADKVLRDAQSDLLKELKGYLPEQPVSHPSVDIQTYLNKHPGAGVGGSGIVRSPLGGF